MGKDQELVVNDQPEWSPDDDDWYERARLAEVRLEGSRRRVMDLLDEVEKIKADLQATKSERDHAQRALDSVMKERARRRKYQQRAKP